MLSELFIAKFTNNFAALHILIQPLVYQVQCIFCIWLKHISLIQSTIESLIQKFSFPKILTILRNLRSIVISKISRHLQNTPLKKGLKFLERTFLQPIYFFFTLSTKKFTNNLPRDLQIFIPHKVKKSCSTSEVAVIFCYNCTRQIIMNDHNLSFV